MASAITPGPLLESCPSPTEIDCIEVTKVYDSCFQTEDFSNLCATIPYDDCCREIANEAGTTATCAVTASSSTFVSSVPTGVDDFVNATFAVSITETITLTSATGRTCSFTLPVSFVKTVTLCGPSGTTQVCTIAGTTCGPCAIIGDQVCCELVACLVLESVATVELLVPSFGFCVPSACSVLGLPPCPPTFPSSCTTTSTTAGAGW